MRYIVGVIVLLVVVCAIGAFFVEEGFANEDGQTALDYYKSVSAQTESTAGQSNEDISGSDISGTPTTKIVQNPSSYSENLLLYAKNAKIYPDGSSSLQSSPGSSNLGDNKKSPSIVQGQVYDKVSPVMNDDGRYASPSQLMPGDNSYVPRSSDDDDMDDNGHVAVQVKRHHDKHQCPDMSQYIRKDAIPCWGCKL